MESQKSFEYNGAKYLMVAVKFIDNVVIRVSREGEFLYDSDISDDAYKSGKHYGKDLIEESFQLIEAEIKQKH